MYYPFFRGKQFELLLLKEIAEKIAEWNFVPIIEPVKSNFSALLRALEALIEHDCHFILICNPQVGELEKDNSALWSDVFKNELLSEYTNFAVGLNLTASDRLATAENFFNDHSVPTAIIHWGFSEGKVLSELIRVETPNITEHIFVEHKNSTTLYRKHFTGTKRVIVKDGFNVQKNIDYPPAEPFSELYLIYEDLSCDGFGDFLIVGSDYQEGGGPAYAIAIHLTYIDSAADNAIAIKHYVSDRGDTPKDPAGKYLEALEKLDRDVRERNSLILQTDAVKEYLHFFHAQHFPGLGYTKKLSMQHHLELMAHLLTKEA